MRKILWLIPPLLGVAFYAARSVAESRGISPADGSGKVADRGAAMVDRMVPVGASAEEMEQAKEDELRAEWDRIQSYDGEQLRQLIPQLLDSIIHKEGWGAGDGSWADFLNEAVTRLGRLEKGAGLPWLVEHVAIRREYYMEGWAEADPAGAFEEVVTDDVREPCSDETLGKLLQSIAAQGPDRLREACLRIPWERFLYSPDSSLSLHFDPANDVRPWIDSGILPELQRRGVDCGAILDRWSEQYPREVLAQWRAGNELITANPQIVTGMLLQRNSVSPERERAIAAVLSELPEEEQDRLLKLSGEDPDDESYPELRKRTFDPDRAIKYPEGVGQ